jgi:D-alanyl-D-alanine carboxypeptidase
MVARRRPESRSVFGPESVRERGARTPLPGPFRLAWPVMRRSRCLAAFVGALAVVATLVTVAAPAAEAAPARLTQEIPSPKADIVVDATTGEVLIADNIHESLPPASTAKIMTALVAVERLAPGSIIAADPNTAAIPTNKIGFDATAKWTLEQMLAALMMVSANDAAYALAKATANGDLNAFATQATATARRYGMKETTLNDPSGLDNAESFMGGPRMSAYDLAIATRNALAVPELAKWAALPVFDFTDPQGIPHHFVNHNRMLAGGAFAYDGMTGFKTGYTDRAGQTFVGTATRNGRTLIAVVLGSPASPYVPAAALLDAAFAMPVNAPGTGETLPDIKVSLFADRAGDLKAFRDLGRATAAGAGGSTVAPSVPVFDQLPNEPPSTVAAVAGAAAAAAGSTGDSAGPSSGGGGGGGGGGVFQLRSFIVVLLILGIALFVLRRRAVKRQRAIRMARQRQRAAKMRSGGLPVVDGRYRTGMRLGQPVESHVRLRRAEDQY